MLKRHWHLQHPDLFNELDFGCRQPTKYFAEWYAAVLLKDKLRAEQIGVFDLLQQSTGVKVVVFQFRYR